MSSSQNPSPMALDLSRRCTVRVSPLHTSHSETLNRVRHPEWYRTPQSRSAEVLEHGSGHPTRHRGAPLSQGLGMDLLPKGLNGNLWDPGFYEPESSASSISDSDDGDDSQSDSDVIFLVSTTRDTLLCRSFSSGSASPLVDPLSPAAPSGDEGRGCFLLPQTLSSPSPGYTNSEESSDGRSRSPPALQPSRLVDPLGGTSSDDSDVVEVPVTYAKSKRTKRSCTDRRADGAVAREKSVSPLRRELRRSARVRKDTPPTREPSHHVCSHHLRSRAKSTNAGLQNDGSDCGDMDSTGRLSDSAEDSWVRPAVTQRIGLDCDISKMEVQEASRIPFKSLQREPPASRPKPETSQCRNSKRKPEKPLSQPRTKRFRGKPKKGPKKVSPGNKDVEKNNVNKRRRRKRQRPTGPSSMFSPVEPEIRLKYANYKGEKKDNKSDNFFPFVHVEHKECTVVNHHDEEEMVKSAKGQPRSGTNSFSTVVPKSSCFRLGRLGSGSGRQPAEARCCLCGGSSNATGLGDLHGPYYPAGPVTGLRHQDNGKTRPPPPPESVENGSVGNGHAAEAVDEEGAPATDAENTARPSPAKPAVVDSRCPVEAAQHADERWLHEDCVIWTTGVYLVKGRLYGLEEAARLAQETVCSTCYNTGATMGCFLKSCPAKYHYTCAIQSGCVLNEENFSLRCCKHKDKSFRGVSR